MYTEKTVNGYLVGESEVLAMNGTNNVPGPAISAPLGGKKVAVGIQVTVVGGASAGKLTISYSFDGVNFTPEVDVIDDIVATSTGVKSALVDLTGVSTPYYRLSLGGVASLGTSGRFKLIYAAPSTEIY